MEAKTKVEKMVEILIKDAVNKAITSTTVISSLKKLSEEYQKIMPNLTTDELKEEITECDIASKILKNLWWNDILDFDLYTEISHIVFDIRCKAEHLLNEKEFNRYTNNNRFKYLIDYFDDILSSF